MKTSSLQDLVNQRLGANKSTNTLPVGSGNTAQDVLGSIDEAVEAGRTEVKERAESDPNALHFIGVTETAAVATLTLEQVEREHIFRVLGVTGGNKSKAAKNLGISLKTLYNKLHAYGVLKTKTVTQET